MLGGTKLIVSGPCFALAKTVTLHLSKGETVECKMFTRKSVSCISPLLYRTGKETVLLKVVHQNNTESSFDGSLSIGE